MNFEKLVKDLQNLSSKISTKAGEIIKDSAEAIREGAEKASAKASYATQLAALNWNLQSLQKKVAAEHTKLGALVFTLYKEDRLKQVRDESAALFASLATLEKEISELEAKKNHLAEQYGVEPIDNESIDALTRDLEAGGGTLMQIVVDANSPILNKKLKDIRLPKEALIATIVRGEQVIIPDGQTTLAEGDKISILGKDEDVKKAVAELSPPSGEEAKE